MISDAAAARLYIAVIIIAVTLFFVVPWIADLIFNVAKAFLAARSAGQFTFGAN